MLDKMGMHQSQILEENQENSMNSANSCQGDENQRMYTTLLQNQVLGIQNPHLISGGYLNDEFMDSVGCVEKSIPLSLAPPSSYNVLRFNQRQVKERKPLELSNPYQVAPFAGFEEE